MSEGRNINSEIAQLRDTFLTYEKDYVNQLLKDKKNLQRIESLKKAKLEDVVDYAKRLMTSMDLGVHTFCNGEFVQVNEKMSYDIEKEICLALYSIEDLVNTKELVKVSDDEMTR